VEIVRDGRPCAPGEVGEVLITDLHNYGMPLIRYRVGDLASWKAGGCPCGRGLPLLEEVHGRSLDVIRTPEGKTVSGVFFPHLFKDAPGIARYQVIQERLDSVRIQLLLESGMPAEHQLHLQREVARALGPGVKTCWEIGPDVTIERRAKFRPVISLLAPERAAGSGSGA
jgi:phenylacetate-CoA ligase